VTVTIESMPVGTLAATYSRRGLFGENRDGLDYRAGSVCRDEARRADVKEHPTLNGIDFVEYERRARYRNMSGGNFLKALPIRVRPTEHMVSRSRA